MIHPLNLILLGITIILLLFVSCKREGFNKINHINRLGGGGDGGIPPVPKDVLCMVLHSMGVPNVDRMGDMSNKCAFDSNDKKEDTETCKY